MSMKQCKRCLLLESAEADTLKDIRERLQKIPLNEKVDDALYQQRLAFCKECEHLLSGVCQKCGCYVEFRAAFAKQKCPNVKKRQW